MLKTLWFVLNLCVNVTTCLSFDNRRLINWLLTGIAPRDERTYQIGFRAQAVRHIVFIGTRESNKISCEKSSIELERSPLSELRYSSSILSPRQTNSVKPTKNKCRPSPSVLIAALCLRSRGATSQWHAALIRRARLIIQLACGRAIKSFGAQFHFWDQ